MGKVKAGFTTFTIIACAAIVLCLSSCAVRKKADHVGAKADNSRISLDWDGIYTGSLPCADCEGIQTVIRIKKDLTYIVQTKYLGKPDEVFESNGAFSWNEEGSKILLKNTDEGASSSMYLAGENVLFHLDSNGNRIAGELADRYTLRKAHPGITEKYWKLVEIYDKPVTPDEKFMKEPHLILKIEGGRIIGHGGCNSFTGGYELKDFNRIIFSKIVSTKMACMNMEIETQLFRMLEAVDNYLIKGDTLILNKAKMTPLARFEAVYLK